MNNEYNILINRLDSFIRKYYLNKVLKGLILFGITGLLYFLCITFLEYFGHFSVIIRTILFYSACIIYLFTFVYYIFIPLLKLVRIGPIISYKKASAIISEHFFEIKDKLINILELANLNSDNSQFFSQELVLASINLKINEIRPFHFNKAVNLKRNYKYLPWLFLLIAVIGSISFISPSIITEGTERIIKHDEFFAPKAPFQFKLLNDTLSVLRGNNYLIKLQIVGEFIPSDVNIKLSGSSFRMKKESNSLFTYEFRNLNNSFGFYFNSDTYNSEAFTLKVLPNPSISSFSVFVDPPAYTGESSFQVENIGDLTIPIGSDVRWTFNLYEADNLIIAFDNNKNFEINRNDNKAFIKSKIFQSTKYSVSLSNQFVQKSDLLKYSIEIIPDLYPEITVKEVRDSSVINMFYYNGLLNDDYGFSKLTFNYYKKPDSKNISNIKIDFNSNLPSQEFFYSFDFNSVEINPGDEIVYYFEVWDNDRVSGPKSSKTSEYSYKIPTLQEVAELSNKMNNELESNVEKSISLTNEIQKEIQQYKENQINNSSTDWQQNQLLNDILEKQNSLEKMMEQISQKNKEKNQLNNNLTEEQSEILEKQKQIEDLVDNLLSDELKKMIEEIQKLQNQAKDEKLNELTEKLQLSYDDLSKQLDKNLELLKRYEVEENVTKTIERLENLSEQQKNLSEQTDYKDSDLEQIKQKQDNQEAEFQNAIDEYNKTIDKNKDLEKPMQLEKFEKEISQIQKEFQNSKESLNDSKRNKSSKSQKSNSENLQNLSQQMNSMMSSIEMQGAEENIEDLQNLLDNLIRFSFEQEDLIYAVSDVSRSDPKYVENMILQSELRSKFEVIEDSLLALSGRIPQINTAVNKEMSTIKQELNLVLTSLEDRNISLSKTKQQVLMTSANNLALLLNEVLQNLQNQMSKGGGGGGKSKKQNKNQKQGQKPGEEQFSKMKGQQQSLKSQLESMLKQMKNGMGKQDNNSALQKQLAEMIKHQEMFEQMLNNMRKDCNLTPYSQQKLNEIQKMLDETKKDMVFENINQQTVQRQSDILTKLLEAETAERERKFDKKRESKEAKDMFNRNITDELSYKKIKESFKENLNTTNIKLNNFYQNKYKQYLIKLNHD